MSDHSDTTLATETAVAAVQDAHRVLGALVRALDAGALSMNPSTLLTDIHIAFKKLDTALSQRPIPAMKEGK